VVFLVKKEEKKLPYNVTDHLHVPKHEIVSDKEKEAISQNYKASFGQFPQILVSDPVIREIGGKPGDLVKITRKSPTSGESIYYRIVVVG
jgi:DNA-directed RNA polymerase subunit H